jgi:hypothetical protein
MNIYQSATGKIVASFSPPGPYHDFTAVARLGGDRTFVAAAVTGFRMNACSTRLYRFSIDARGRPTGLTPLSVPLVRGQVNEFVGSADGNVLAYTASGFCTRHHPGVAGVIRPATGQVTTWRYQPGRLGSLSLTADGSMLGFAGSNNAWILPTSAPPGTLTSHARRVLHVRAGVFRMVLNSTGSQAYVETRGGSRDHPVVVLVLYSTATGKRIRLLGRLGPGPGQLFSELSVTVDAAGQHMIVYGYYLHTPAVPGRRLRISWRVRAGHPRPAPITEMNLTTGRQASVAVAQEPYLDAAFDSVAW